MAAREEVVEVARENSDPSVDYLHRVTNRDASNIARGAKPWPGEHIGRPLYPSVHTSYCPGKLAKMGDVAIALGGILVGAIGAHLLSRYREQSSERRRSYRNIARIFFRDLFQIHMALLDGRVEKHWPPAVRTETWKIRLANWHRLGPDFTIVCDDEELWESVCIAFEWAEDLDAGKEMDIGEIESVEKQIFDAVERTGDVNKPWRKRLEERWKQRMTPQGPTSLR